MKQLKSFMVMNIANVNRISVSYDEIDNFGIPTSQNNKISFYAVEKELNSHIEAIQEILSKKLEV